MNNRPPDPRLFYLLARAQHRLRKTADRLSIEALGVSSAQLAALYWLQRNPEAQYTQLAQALGQNRSAITGLVSRMTSQGLVTQVEAPDDKRAFNLSLTAEGMAVVKRARPLQDRFNQTMTEGFEPAEVDVIARFLEQLLVKEFS